jgi:PEP-CTERM motif
MKKWIATLALVACSVAAQAGVATVNGRFVADTGTTADPYELGSVMTGSTTTLSAGLYGRVGTEFEEHASFVVGQDLNLSGSANTLTLRIFGINIIDIDDFSVQLWGGVHPTGASLIADFDGNNTTVNFGMLQAGTYHLDMFGTLGANLGVYSVTLQAAPVPEPSTYALMLAGLGVMGFIARRRRETI